MGLWVHMCVCVCEGERERGILFCAVLCRSKESTELTTLKDQYFQKLILSFKRLVDLIRRKENEIREVTYVTIALLSPRDAPLDEMSTCSLWEKQHRNSEAAGTACISSEERKQRTVFPRCF
jgi:hypothetical protein